MEGDKRVIEVGMAEMVVASAPNILVTRGLGSCLGIVLFNPIKKIGGLAHPMLPDIHTAKFKNNPSRFVNAVILNMVEELERRGSKRVLLKAKLFGGAHMFRSIPEDSPFNVGKRNIIAAKEVFSSLRIKIVGEDTGGSYGRTIFFDLESGKVKVRTVFHGEKEL
ncbi:MAG: hypothetical protein B6D56_03155 [Candidatus Omnitrophica bacterium 4484_70.1]|nr:MAG: hypothetical protein B6D56_03155 [Candidatus Omnitrophica bacterium 4484_70.1]